MVNHYEYMLSKILVTCCQIFGVHMLSIFFLYYLFVFWLHAVKKNTVALLSKFPAISCENFQQNYSILDSRNAQGSSG
jgi:hypothetical protein